jgi:hypothetical protein
MSLVEVCIAALVMAVAVTGVIGAMGSGMSIVGHSRQRSTGVALAQERLERILGYPYDDVAVSNSPAPTFSADTLSPDNKLSPDGLSYNVGNGTFEPLILRTGGVVTHVDPTYTPPGTTTEFSVYQYVTWVDDPNVTGTTDYKRVTVAVVWNFPVNGGPKHTVTQSTYMSEGEVLTSTPTPTPSASPSGGPSPTSTPSPTPTPVTASCPGDTTEPTGGTMSVLSGSGAEVGYTNSNIVSIELGATDLCAPLTAELSNDGTTFTTSTTLTSGVTSSPTWTVPTGDGVKTIFARFRDGTGNTSGIISGAITLDQTVPTSFTGLAPSNCDADIRSATFNWSPTNEGSSNFLTYRLFRQIDTNTATVEAVTATRSVSNMFDKNKKPVKFWVKAYDKAGNASGSSNVITFTANNSCVYA